MNKAATQMKEERRMPTNNHLASNIKIVSTGLLNMLLADSIDLALVTKQAHWNLKGPNFIALHEMLDGFRSEIDGHVDAMAERILQLGGTAHGTSQNIASSTRLAPYPTDITTSADHLAALIDRYATVSDSVRNGIDEVANAGDANTSDILTGYSRVLEKSLWLLEAHTL